MAKVKLPRISGRTCVKALAKIGFVVVRQSGSHIILVRSDPPAQVVVPNHTELDKGTLKNILRQAGLTVQQFIELL
ncbi:MAG: type II toxin-antitoxin system HicA family toxin [Anaerolineae bacterium]|nr:type II toxin-antitoxin system HicA family toxin [Anaerolineae bacterium]